MSSYPNPKTHLILSLYKSSLRIIAGLCICFKFSLRIDSLIIAGILIILAEIIGIIEELV
jgi:hypothetical protein